MTRARDLSKGLQKTVFKFSGDTGQTTFTTADDSTALSYTVGLIDVYYNGVKLAESEYTATNGTSIVLDSGVEDDDIIEVVAVGSHSFTGGGDMNGSKLILDTDGDTSIHADTDDQIDIEVGGSDVVSIGSKMTGSAVTGKQTIWIPAAAMYPESTNGCAELAQVELSNGPELKCLDFDPSSDEHAQFTVAFPKSWNEGTVTFQAFFTVSGTNTGTTAWGLAGVAFADNGDINTAFGTRVVATAKAHSGTSGDLDVSAESGAVTIAGSPSTDELVFFQIMRDVSADDQSGDARLLGIKLFYTNDALSDD